LFYEAQNGLLTSASDYGDLYSALLAACSVFSGTAGGEPGAPPLVLPGSSQIYFPMLTNRYRYTGITASDCQQVKNALDAVEMYSQPTSCAAPDVPLCQAGSRPTYLFSDDLENITSGNWSSKSIYGANAWYYPQTASPYGENATYATSGRYNFLGVNLETKADFTIGMNHSIALPAGKAAYLHFKHAYDFELGSYDGGVLEYSLNSGLSWHDAGQAFVNENGYRGIISPSFGNPLAGRQAFVNSSYGYISSRYNLEPFSGGSIRFRFRIGTDEGVSRVGWFIDDINIYTCDPVPTPTPTTTPTQAPATSTPGNSP
jgi:bacillolysin